MSDVGTRGADDVALTLISHTNVGKTTLARTLLRRDIGQVLDQAHVTEVSEAHELAQADGARLLLWDTPGFGDTLRLLKRLRNESNPIGWFLHQVWDRVTDRPLWCGQEAVRNVRQDADVVLYLVNAMEDPAEAGYVGPELELLTWLDKPVVVLLNQTGAVADDEGVLQRWRAATADHPVVKDVMVLDAFTRCWVQECLLLRRVAEVLDGPRHDAMLRLAAAWDARHLATYHAMVQALAEHLARAAADRQPSGSDRADVKRAAEKLADRQRLAVRDLMERLIDLAGLDGRVAVELEEHLERDFAAPATPPSVEQGALWGGLISGALGGLAADVMAGGLTLGGGLLAGALLGAFGGAGLMRGMQIIGGKDLPAVRWSPEFLEQLTGDVLLRAWAVMHFGRGRGEWQDPGRPERWKARVEKAVTAESGALSAIWPEADDAQAVAATLAPVLRRATAGMLTAAYPGAEALFRAV